MLETLAHYDQVVFYFINVKLANPITDLIMPEVTSDWNLRILYAVAMIALIWKGNRQLRWLVLFSILTLALTDQVSSIFLKDWIGRIRPCATLSGVHLLVGCGAGKSMPSSHAANCFGQAALFGLLYVQARWPLVIFASVVALSRVFVGVHYPGDVLVGTMIGLTIGLIVALVFRRLPVSAPKNTP